MKITFTDTTGTGLELPKPASRLVPEWYKNTDSYLNDNKKIPSGTGDTTGTIKKCIPVFDAITAGYIIETPSDVWVSFRDGNPYFEWSSYDMISFHPIEQAPLHPNKNGYSYPKWMNPWSIKTPKGYSTLFVQPFHRESPFEILPGIVDTDQYFAAVNFPFVMKDRNFEGLIPVGTPMAQVIPFKRESWSSELGDTDDLKNQDAVVRKLRTKIFDKYKTLFWTKKEYK